MKKILIVVSDNGIREAISLACKKWGFEVITADHANALNTFLAEEPASVIVCDYSQSGDKKYFSGVETYNDIKNSATNEIVLRMGFSKLDHADYIKMPFNLEELKKKLTKKGGG
jgi:DNA-binding NtrC family response regulator